jgi:hypothetical protein
MHLVAVHTHTLVSNSSIRSLKEFCDGTLDTTHTIAGA